MRRAVLILALFGAGCPEPRSAQCKAVCAREAVCRESPDDQTAFDEGDCVAACAVLERDKKTAAMVNAYAACVKQAGRDCAKLAACR